MSAVARLNEWEHPKPIWILVANLELLGQLARRRRAPRLSHGERAIGSMETRRFEPLERGDWTHATRHRVAAAIKRQ